jgi:hypothetical protein
VYPVADFTPPQKEASAQVVHQQHCTTQKNWLSGVLTLCRSDSRVLIDYVPLHIVIAEICKDERLDDFREKYHRRPQTIAQSSQQSAARIQDLQKKKVVPFT